MLKTTKSDVELWANGAGNVTDENVRDLIHDALIAHDTLDLLFQNADAQRAVGLINNHIQHFVEGHRPEQSEGL